MGVSTRTIFDELPMCGWRSTLKITFGGLSMRRISCSLIFLFSMSAFGAPVQIDISNVVDGRGLMNISLFNNAGSWQREVPDQVLTINPVATPVSTITVDLPPGEYGFFMYQDLNSDGKLKRTMLGFPAEPYAFSNDVKIDFKKPTFDQMKFVVAPDVTTIHTVKLNNP